MRSEVVGYLAGRMMVAAPGGGDLRTLAAKAGARILRSPGRSGYGVVAGSSAARAALIAEGATVLPEGRIRGAGWWDGGDSDSDPVVPTDPPTSWHLDAAMCVPGPFSGLVVAVLDTGIAYEDHGIHVRADGLSAVSFVAPADFVEFDGHPNDDHQHGTHIASLIASEGSYPGVAPGVSLMPIKVLDANNTGSEWALIEGIHHAVDHGADVINLSLSFPLGYVEGPALTEALIRARDAGVVVVAAAGNDGARELTLPAASRLVIAVGASVSDPGAHFDDATDYSNRSPGSTCWSPVDRWTETPIWTVTPTA